MGDDQYPCVPSLVTVYFIVALVLGIVIPLLLVF